MIEWCKARSVKEWLALIALFASIGGAAVLTVNRYWLITILERAKQWTAIADIALLDTIIIGIVLLSFGLAINKRNVRGKAGPAEFEVSGGE